MTHIEFTTDMAKRCAALALGKLILGQANLLEHYCTTHTSGRKVYFYFSVAPFKGKNRYFINAYEQTFPRDPKAEDRISDKTYQDACRFFDRINIELAHYTF